MFLHGFHTYRASDSYLRQTVYKLYSAHGSCSGVKVTAPSGKAYVLSAGHCTSLVEDGKIKADDEEGNTYTLDFLDEDPYSDLMLLSAPLGGPSVSVGKDLSRHEHIHTLTHGRGYPTFRTDGEVVKTDLTTIGGFPVYTLLDLLKCSKEKERVVMDGDEKICALQTFQYVTTASVIPGSSGGPMFNEDGKLVGIASAIDDRFSSFVTIADMVLFLKGR